MQTSNIIIKTILLLVIFTNISCEHKEKNNDKPPERQVPIKETSQVTIDSFTTPNSVTITGTDESGNTVHGEGIIEGNTGLGTLIQKDGRKKDIIFEQINANNIIATDDDGFKYKLKLVLKVKK
ncbi:hypothetical protein [Flavobacterium sp. PL002]|uniref:hypothetical protein n=1 Tax=Flavobacterium sp. PL002 TaxID=1897058 RepID=UPI001788472A|nr:hypothetical protein [Flavobacterium sp. PL002]MBE0393418.1 hypothetical protein [Flavobacterium sp. PL002]